MPPYRPGGALSDARLSHPALAGVTSDTTWVAFWLSQAYSYRDSISLAAEDSTIVQVLIGRSPSVTEQAPGMPESLPLG